MNIKNFGKRWASILTTAILTVNLMLPAHIAAAAELVYLDQFQEFEIDDHSGMLTTIANLTYKLSFDEEGNICANTTKFKNKEIDSTEKLAEEFENMLGVVSDVCWDKVITVNAAKYGPKFSEYGRGKILEWYRDVNLEVANAPQEETKEEEKEEEKEEQKEEVKVVTVVTEEGTDVIIDGEVKEETKEEEKQPVVEEKEEPKEEVKEEVKEIVEEQPEEVKEASEDTETQDEEEETEEIIEEKQPEEEAEEAVEAEENNEEPDFALTDEELEEIVNNEVVENPEEDSDNDGITNEEEVQAGTDPEEADSDFDGIVDAEDVNPVEPDSDGDLIPDSEDAAPLDDDANDNGINDLAEEVYGLEGVQAATVQQDDDENGVPDVIDEIIEEETGLDIENSYEDSDGDGASDALEAVLGTGPTEANNISEEFTDAESIIGYKSIKRKSRPNAIITTNVKAYLASPQDGEVTTDQTLFFQGNAPQGAMVKFFYKDPKTGIAKVFGSARAQTRNKFVGEARELPHGEYEIFTRTYNSRGQEIDRTAKISVTIAENIPGVEKAATEKPTIIGLNDKQGTTEAGKKLVLKAGERTVAKGFTKPGNLVIAEWQSLILSSAVIADQDGYYEIATPSEGLEANEDHTLWLYSVDPETDIQSENAKVEFTIGESTAAAVTNLDAGGTKNIAIILIAVLLLGVAGLLIVLRKKKTPTPPAAPMGQ